MRVTEENYHEVLTPGREVFKVYGLGIRSFMIRIRVTGNFVCHRATWWAGVTENSFGITMLNRPGIFISLQDAGIIPNSYNKHQTFTTWKEAVEYLAEVIHA